MKFEKLNLFFDRVKNLGFWQRIFAWGPVRALSFEAYQEFREFQKAFEETDPLRVSNASLLKESERLRLEKHSLEEKLAAERDKRVKAEQDAALLQRAEADRQKEHDKRTATLADIQAKIQADRDREIQARQEDELRRLESQKETWARHQENVKQTVKGLCQKLTIEYVDKVPFKGSPDNALKICGQFLVLDAKSPYNDDLGNFQAYVKREAEGLKKYAKEDGVRKDFFLVVPSNAISVFEQRSYNLGDYNAYVVTPDALEPILLVMKKLEEYEFVNELSPEDREAVCRVIGKLVATTKRRLQVDQFFMKDVLKTLRDCESDLPADIAGKAGEFERAEKLNPTEDRRGKEIRIDELEAESEKIRKAFPLFDAEGPQTRALPPAKKAARAD